MLRARAIVAGVLWAALALAPASIGAADAVPGFPRTVRIASDADDLVLNGTAERWIFFFRIYDIGLYLPARRNTLSGVLQLPGPKRLQLHMQRTLSAKQVRDYLVKRMADGTQPAEMSVLQKRMAEISRIIDSVRVLKDGDTLALDFLPGKGTTVRVNNVAHGEPIAGDEFFHALLRIWIGENARNHVLRDALLGRVAG